jgi:NADP-dependent 3-hydroxy acid dehydrogenase YdfG
MSIPYRYEMDTNIHSNLTMSDNHSLQYRPNKVALVTGSSSGIGLETALLLSRSGFQIYATMRNLKSKNITEIANTENLSFDGPN